MTLDPTTHPKDRTTPEEWAVLNLADAWLAMDDRVRESEGKECVPEAYVAMMAFQYAVREWRERRVYGEPVARNGPDGTGS